VYEINTIGVCYGQEVPNGEAVECHFQCSCQSEENL
jgi:hypothetical protein